MMVARHWLGQVARAARSPRREAARVVGIFSLAFAVRLIYNLTAAGVYRPTYDAALYDMLARNLLNRHCYCLFGTHLAVSRAPLWPWIMSVIYTVTGEHDFYARLFLCVLGSGTCLIVYRFARDIFGVRAAAVAGTIAATYTGLFLYDGWLYTESLYTFCVTGFTYSLYRLQTPGSPERAGWKGATSGIWRRVGQTVVQHRWAILCGVFAGAASLTRPNGVAVVGVLSVWAAIKMWARKRPWQQTLRNTLLAMVIAVALIAPWTYRNYTVAHAFIPVETGLGEVMLGAYNDTVAFGPLEARGVWRLPPGALNHDDVRYTPETDQQYVARALLWIGAHPLAVPYLWGLHLAMMWAPYSYAHGLAIEESPSRIASYVIWALIFVESIPVFLSAALGLWTTWRRWSHELLPVYIMLAAAVGQNVMLYGTMRFRAPIEPLLALLVSGLVATGIPHVGPAFFDLLARWRTRKRGKVMTTWYYAGVSPSTR
jgi:4-amino-4-deoxy-L-arabinose transferase-like glycosyltransferase